MSASIDYLYLPGTPFILISLLTIWLHKMKGDAVKAADRNFFQDEGPTIALFAAVALCPSSVAPVWPTRP